MDKKQLGWLLLASVLAPLNPAAASDPFAELDKETAGFGQPPPAGPTSQTYENFEAYKKAQLAAFESYKKKLLAEFEAYKSITQQEVDRFTSEVGEVWDTAELSSQTVWVEYSGDLSSRTRVDFEKKEIEISTTSSKNDLDGARQSLTKKLEDLLQKDQAEAFQDNQVAQAIEKKVTEQLELVESATVTPTPILTPFLLDDSNPDDSQLAAVVDYMLENGEELITQNKNGQEVVTLRVPLAAPEALTEDPEPPTETTAEAPQTTEDKKRDLNKAREMADSRLHKLPKEARALSEYVHHYAGKLELDPSLVFAIIETESAFNPQAQSPIPAYGLMQIVPESAGQDATQALFGKARILSPSYLFTKDKNIEIGTIYLDILMNKYLKGIDNLESRLFCVIAAYNTGSGNVSKAFTGNMRVRKAFPVINEMTPEEVYDHLIENLPYEETRNYLRKVVERIPKYSA